MENHFGDVDILGVNWSIDVADATNCVAFNADEELLETAVGTTKEILLANLEKYEMDDDKQELYRKAGRQGIIEAFMHESAFACHDESTIEWIETMMPRMLAAFAEAGMMYSVFTEDDETPFFFGDDEEDEDEPED